MNLRKPQETSPRPHNAADDEKPFGPKIVLGLSALILASFMVPLDSTIVVVALPALRHDLALPEWQLNFVVDGYSIFFGSMLLTGGALADRFGRRTVFLIGTLVFMLASLACGLAASGTLLITSRCLQGLGGAVMLSATLGLISEVGVGSRRSNVYAAYSSALGVGAAIGPFCGGLLVQYLDWRWCFFVNLIVGALVFAGGLLYVPASRKRLDTPIDVGGTTTLTAGLFFLCYACLTLTGNVHLSTRLVVPLFFSAASLVAFVYIEARVSFPMIGLDLLLERRFMSNNISAALSAASFWSTLAYLPRYVSSQQSASPLQSGLIMLPLTVPLITAPFIAHRLLRRISSSAVLTIGGCLICGGWLLYLTYLDGSFLTKALAGLIAGTGAGMVHSQLAFTAVRVAPPESSGMASGFVSTMRQSGLALGVAALGVIYGTAQSPAVRGIGASNSLHSRMQWLLLSSAALGLLSGLMPILLRTGNDRPR